MAETIVYTNRPAVRAVPVGHLLRGDVDIMAEAVSGSWDRTARIFWVEIRDRSGRSWAIGLPLSLIVSEVVTSLKRHGIPVHAEIGAECASVDGFGAWLKRKAKKVGKVVSRAAKHATTRIAKSTLRIGKVAVMPWRVKHNIRELKGEAKQMKRDLRRAKTGLQVAQTFASFVPGIGTIAAGALGAAVAIGEGKSILNVGKAAALGALPGGPLVRAAVETGIDVASGKRVDRALVAGMRNAVPGGKLGQAAFDAAVAVGQGQRIDRALLSSAVHVAGAVAAGANLDRIFPAVGGQALAAVAAATHTAALHDAAQVAKRVVAAGRGTAGHRALLADAAASAGAIAGLHKSRDPRAKLAIGALRAAVSAA